MYASEPGIFDLLIGTSARNIVCTKRVNIQCKDLFGISDISSIGVVVQNPRAVEILNRIMEDDILMLAHVALEFAPDKSLSKLWVGTNIQGALKAKGWSESEISSRYQQNT